jgi:phosphatidylglycerophosphate synthase
MSNIDRKYENPVDIILYDSLKDSLKFYYDLGLTPNHITTLSIICGFLTAYFLYINKNFLAFIFFWLAYYYDCMDGALARKYKLYSSFGDIYDHLSDYTKFGAIIYTMYLLKPKKVINYSPIFIIFALLMAVQMGCQAKYYSNKNDDSKILKLFGFLCPNKDIVNYTKYFGCGTFIYLFSLVVLTF